MAQKAGCILRRLANGQVERFPEGAERTNKNGYVYVKVDGKWRPKARVILEAEGHRFLPGEKVRFKDGNKANFDLKNLEVEQTNPKAEYRRAANLLKAIRQKDWELNNMMKQYKEMTGELYERRAPALDELAKP
jgi:hypothetical protein